MTSDVSHRLIRTEDFPFPYYPGVSEIGRYCVTGEFQEDLNAGRAVVFRWAGHQYSAHKDKAGFFWLQDWADDKNSQTFVSDRDLLDGGILTTGDILGEVLLNVQVECVI